MNTSESSLGAWAREGIAATAANIVPRTVQPNRSQSFLDIIGSFLSVALAFHAERSEGQAADFGPAAFALDAPKPHRLNRLRKNLKRCHSERSEESLFDLSER
jgi:hypothetical protein